jgi:hypothetical protein
VFGPVPLTPVLVDGHTRPEWLVRRTINDIAADGIIWWRVLRRGNKVADEAARRLDGYLCRRTHFPDRPWMMWCWRSSPDIRPFGGMWLSEVGAG